MKLRELLQGIPVIFATADLDLEIRQVSYDSRTTQPGDLFVALSLIHISWRQSHQYSRP